jgi:hypothetical protein
MTGDLTPPRRAHVLELKIEADTLHDLIGYLRNFENQLAAGEITRGVSGGYSSGSIYAYSVDETITHDSWAEALNQYLDAIDRRDGQATEDRT